MITFTGFSVISSRVIVDNVAQTMSLSDRGTELTRSTHAPGGWPTGAYPVPQIVISGWCDFGGASLTASCPDR